jgi:hypothetical protein
LVLDNAPNKPTVSAQKRKDTKMLQKNVELACLAGSAFWKGEASTSSNHNEEYQ